MLNQGIIFKTKIQLNFVLFVLQVSEPLRHIFLPFQDVFSIAKKCHLKTKSALLAFLVLYSSLSWEQRL